MEHIEVVFLQIEQSHREILIAKLSEAGFDGFEEVDDSLIAYVPKFDFENEKLEEFVKGLEVPYKINLIRDQNWNQLWETSFQPVYVGEKVMIRADFHEPGSMIEYDIIITPKMSFGTGHHETTMMMIESMSTIDCKGKAVLDFGTGTGILAIFAEKLGAESVLAIDCDSWSIANAKENFAKNSCKRISLLQSDNLPQGREFDLVLSNINKNIILNLHNEFLTALKRQGILILSGLLDSDLEEVTRLYRTHFGHPHLVLKKNNWGCLTFILERIDH